MDGFLLKIIALIAMFIDHTGVILDMYSYSTVLRLIGRIAFPIYAFLIAEGCFYTKNIKKYMFRLFIFGVISQLPFVLFTGNINNLFKHLNVFFTLALGVLCIYSYNVVNTKITREVLKRIIIVFSCYYILILAERLNTDYGALGVLLIYCLYLCKSTSVNLYQLKIRQLLILSLFILLSYMPSTRYGMYMFIGGSISLIPIMLYNGEKGKSFKWGFYAFYPIHLLLLALIRYLFL